MTYATKQSKGPRGKEVRTHVHPYRGREYLHTKYENGEWLWSYWKDGVQIFSLDGVELPLWRYEKLATAEASEMVLLCEGELDVETAERLGFLATSVPSGALCEGKEWLPIYMKTLARFDRVAILEDNDDTGREHHVPKCGRALWKLVPDLRVVSFRELHEHGDLTDWILSGHTAEDLRARITAAPQWTPPEWAEPIPLVSVSGLAAFPTHHLRPAWFRDMVEASAAETLTPSAAAAMVMLAVVAAALARKVAVHVWDNWSEPVNLYTVTVLPPSDLKTPIYKMGLAPLERWQRIQAAALKDTIAKAENERANLKARLEATRKKAGRTDDEAERGRLVQETEDLARKLDKLDVPRAPRILADDATEEVLGRLLMENGGRIAVFSDEAGPLKNMAGRYQKNGAAVFEVYKHAHNGGAVRVDRIGREPVDVPLAALTLGLMVQPSVLRGLKDVPELKDEGLLPRILWAVPDSLAGGRDWNATAGVPLHVADAYRQGVTNLLNLPPSSDETGAPAPHVVELSAGARSLVNPFRNELELRIRRGGDLAHVSGWVGKLTGEAIRIAALLHLAEHAGRNAEPWREPVSVEAMESGIAIARDFLIPHALGAFTLIDGGPESELAGEILAWIRRHALARFTKRDLHRHLRRQVDNIPSKWDAPLALLVECEWIRATASEPKKKGRRTEGFEVNPKALEGSVPRPEDAPDQGDAWEGPDHD